MERKRSIWIGIRCQLVLILLTLPFAGCSQHEMRGGALDRVMDVIDSGKPYMQEDVEAKAAVRAQRLAKVLAQCKNEPEGPCEYHVGIDDVLEIGVLSLEEPGKMSTLLRTVGENGAISLPFVGDGRVAGYTVEQLQKGILSLFKGRYIKDPEVTVRVSQYRSAQVLITGAVSKPGIYYLTKDHRSLLEMLAEADGLKKDVGDEVSILRAPAKQAATNTISLAPDSATNTVSAVPEAVTNAVSSTETGKTELVVVDLRDLIDKGDLRLNVSVKAGDVINVTSRERKIVYVLGYVIRPGGFDMQGEKIDVLGALAMAGGPAGSGRPENSWVIRKNEKGTQEVTAVDITKIIRGVRPSFDLHPGDTLLIGSSLVAKLTEFVRPAVSVGASVGANYAPVP